jgi:hypothetical protein
MWRPEFRYGQDALNVIIGGEIQIHHLTKELCGIYALDRFEDYASDEKVSMKGLISLNRNALPGGLVRRSVGNPAQSTRYPC